MTRADGWSCARSSDPGDARARALIEAAPTAMKLLGLLIWLLLAGAGTLLAPFASDPVV
jgi:hypothetical protein